MRTPTPALPMLVLSLAAVLSATAFADPLYRIVPVTAPNLAPDEFPEAVDLHDDGRVIGHVRRGLEERGRPFLWSNGTLSLLPLPSGYEKGIAQRFGSGDTIYGDVEPQASGAARRLATWNGMTPSVFASQANDIPHMADVNAAGQRVGHAFDAYLYPRPTLWEGGLSIDLGTFGGRRGLGAAINSQGWIVGTAETAGTSGSPGPMRGFIWIDGEMRALGTLGGASSAANDINDDGLVVGSASSGAFSEPFAWSGGALRNIAPAPGVGAGKAYEVTESGLVGGDAKVNATSSQAFVFDGVTSVALGVPANLAGGSSTFKDMNEAGQVVGEARAAGATAGRATLTLSRTGPIVDLNDRVDPADPLRPFITLLRAERINDAGQVLVVGADSRLGGTTRSYLLTPVPGTDASPPVIKPLLTGVQGLGGWYVGDVQLTWSVTDRQSTVGNAPYCSTSPQLITTDTPGTTQHCGAYSAGGVNSRQVFFRRDATPPIVTTTLSPAPNAYGWWRQNVTVSFSGTDAMSGGVSCASPAVISAQGASLGASGACFDAAGNQGVGTASGVKIDKTAGTASIRTPAAGASYALGSVVAASYTCADALSGVLSCKGTVASGSRINTSVRGGPYTFRVDVTDRAGNVSSSSVSYYVR